MIEFKKDHWYWVRYKFGQTISPAKPNVIRENKVTHWHMPWPGKIEKADEIEVIAEIQFPEKK